uniref:PTB domain-containing engulfment adapter protein 1 n=1 Tax=Eptatretus burgeri TaxID=7764 RepID=A0A8C4PWN2_EPTBU
MIGSDGDLKLTSSYLFVVCICFQFLGSCEVDLPKGSEIVKDAIRKLKFACQLKKSEGQKIPKVELQISIRGIQILDPKSKVQTHNCQLQRISFCADDKTDKHIFTFICKDGEQSKHLCFVFDSEKSAEDITLTIGQAFDLAYKKFLESGGKDVEAKKQVANCMVRTDGGEVWKRHVDQMHDRCSASPPPVPSDVGPPPVLSPWPDVVSPGPDVPTPAGSSPDSVLPENDERAGRPGRLLLRMGQVRRGCHLNLTGRRLSLGCLVSLPARDGSGNDAVLGVF